MRLSAGEGLDQEGDGDDEDAVTASGDAIDRLACNTVV